MALGGIVLCVAVCMAGDNGWRKSNAPVDIRIEKDHSELAPDLAGGNNLDKREHERLLRELRVQSSIRKAAELAKQEKHLEVIKLLEPLAGQAEGSNAYLQLLENSYRRERMRLIEARQISDAKVISERLAALGFKPDQSVEARLNPQPDARADIDVTPPPPAQDQKRIGRGKMDLATPSIKPMNKVSALELAEDLYQKKEFTKALAKYVEADHEDPKGVEPFRTNWAYCILMDAVARYNEHFDRNFQGTQPTDMQLIERSLDRVGQLTNHYEREVGEAKAEIAKWRKFVQKRQREFKEELTAVEYTAPAVQHTSEISGHWKISKTTNFVIYHRDQRAAEQVGEAAELARKHALERWFGDEPDRRWTPTCELYLYPTAQEYAASTGIGMQSPGHCKVYPDGNGGIARRQLFIRLDDPSAKSAILQHEIVHVVLADKLAPYPVPKWADEGIAVLTEPADKINAHLDNLRNMRGNRRPAREIIHSDNYPANDLRGFYANSVGICKHLLDLGGERKLISFLKQSLQSRNYDTALRNVYGISGLMELESHFDQFVGRLDGSRNLAARFTIDPTK